MNPKAVLQERYPTADHDKLVIYFRNVEALRGTKRESGRTHRHHICPVAQFPEYEFDYPENLIDVTIEDHIFLHKLLEAAIPEIKSPPNAFLEGFRDANAKGGQKTKETGTGLFAAGMQAKGRQNRTHSQYVAAGRAGGLKCKEQGLGSLAPGYLSTNKAQMSAAKSAGWARRKIRSFLAEGSHGLPSDVLTKLNQLVER
jgi:hypothetical protein